MTIYTLYIKTHKVTGLKYLGQTSKDPYRYKGSGIDWIKHLKEYGNNTYTEILLQTKDKKEINNLGRYYSKLWHILTASDNYGNRIWANRIFETGGGSGEHLIGISRTETTREKIKNNMPDQSGSNNGFFNKKHSTETKIICGKSNLGKDIKTLEGKKKISDSMKLRWQDPTKRNIQIDALSSRKGEKRSCAAIISYKEAARKRDENMTPEQRSARSIAAAKSRKLNSIGKKRQLYTDNHGKKRFRYIPETD